MGVGSLWGGIDCPPHMASADDHLDGERGGGGGGARREPPPLHAVPLPCGIACNPHLRRLQPRTPSSGGDISSLRRSRRCSRLGENDGGESPVRHPFPHPTLATPTPFTPTLPTPTPALCPPACHVPTPSYPLHDRRTAESNIRVGGQSRRRLRRQGGRRCKLRSTLPPAHLFTLPPSSPPACLSSPMHLPQAISPTSSSQRLSVGQIGTSASQMSVPDLHPTFSMPWVCATIRMCVCACTWHVLVVSGLPKPVYGAFVVKSCVY